MHRLHKEIEYFRNLVAEEREDLNAKLLNIEDPTLLSRQLSKQVQALKEFILERYDDQILDLKKSNHRIWNENLLIPDLVGKEDDNPMDELNHEDKFFHSRSFNTEGGGAGVFSALLSPDNSADNSAFAARESRILREGSVSRKYPNLPAFIIQSNEDIYVKIDRVKEQLEKQIVDMGNSIRHKIVRMQTETTNLVAQIRN